MITNGCEWCAGAMPANTVLQCHRCGGPVTKLISVPRPIPYVFAGQRLTAVDLNRLIDAINVC